MKGRNHTPEQIARRLRNTPDSQIASLVLVYRSKGSSFPSISLAGDRKG